jgi:mRNA-degrading endonuclease RelE of RelBE toxin-antitoxin system
MRCSLRIKRSAAKALSALPKADRVRVVQAIDLLCDTPAAGSALKGDSKDCGAYGWATTAWSTNGSAANW